MHRYYHLLGMLLRQLCVAGADAQEIESVRSMRADTNVEARVTLTALRTASRQEAARRAS
eukprot:1923083-Heterocapsa_arctica.AAC.1